MVRKILLGVLVVLGVFAIVVATRPSAFRVERSATIGAPPDQVFPMVNDLRAWAAWSPWEKLDPKMERTYAGAPAGVGATYAWKSGNSDVGQGRMTIEKSDAPSRLVIKLEFIEPFAATNTVSFAIDPAPAANGSRVQWVMEGSNGFLGKMFSLFMNMDKMIGDDFERGLGNLKRLVETPAGQAAAGGAANPG